MTKSILDRVTQVIVQAAHLGPESQLTADTAIVGAGLSLDSVAVLEMLIGLEAEFNVEITAEELMEARGLQSVGRLAEFIGRKTGVAG
jgi:acyl carrier protein